MSGQVSERVEIAPRARSRRLSWQDAEQIAEDVAEARLTETEACLRLKIRPESWFQWKSRHGNSARFEHVVARVRAVTIKSNVQAIRNSSQGIGLKYPDWRAADRLLAIADPSRYGREAGAEQAQTPVNITVMVEALGRVYAKALPPPEPRQIQDVVVVSEQSKPEQAQAKPCDDWAI